MLDIFNLSIRSILIRGNCLIKCIEPTMAEIVDEPLSIKRLLF